MPYKKIVAAALSVLCAANLYAAPARAHSALTIAYPTDIGKDGFAAGYSANQDSLATAQSRAMAKCQGDSEAPVETRALCRFVMSFNNRCLSVAFDPEVSTYGFGWAIGATQGAADEEALARCHSTSTPDRSQFCEIKARVCDVTPGG